jgi:hypothetical protein
VYGNAAFMDEEGHITAPRTDFIHGGNDFLGNEFAALLEYDFINSPTVIARREAWRAAFPIPEELGRSALDDWFLAVKMARRYDFYYLDDVLADVRTHRGSLHTVSSLDGSDERFLDWFLSRIFEEEETRGFEISRGPLNRRRIRGAHSLSFGQRYFGLRMTSDARRCYIQAVRYQPRNLLKGSVLRQLLGTLIGLRTYERLKGMLRFAAPRKLPGSRFRGTGD